METIVKLVFLFFFTFLMAFLFFRSWAKQEKTGQEYKELVKQCQARPGLIKRSKVMIENIEIRKDKNWIAFDIFGVSIQINFFSSKGRYWLTKPACIYIDPWNCAKEFYIDIAEGTCEAYDTIENQGIQQ